MGVPAFFRWLTKKYPLITTHVDRPSSTQSSQSTNSDDSSSSCDNLYLDMNGIIHPCTHPEDRPPPETLEDMFELISEYIEMVMKMTRPSKILYMAVDGVAPRAKMNQQRSRRFRAAQESSDKKHTIEVLKNEMRASGIDLDGPMFRKSAMAFDSNVITPGTEFMMELSSFLRTWIDSKLASPSSLWPSSLVVILSDASVPGEGEHKIMDFIRRQKADSVNFDPNQSHVLCGADADLIMLGLATHELNFSILREEFVPGQPKPCDICAQYGHDMDECEGKEPDLNDPDPIKPQLPGFISIKLNILREYLEFESSQIGLDLERFIDDFVFLCFFVGNDFLPHLPSLEIREGAIDTLMAIYRNMMSSNGRKYLSKDGIVDLEQTQFILDQVGRQEDEVFKKRSVNDARFKARRKNDDRRKKEEKKERKRARREKYDQGGNDVAWLQSKVIDKKTTLESSSASSASSLRIEAANMRMGIGSGSENQEAANRLKAMLMGKEEDQQDQESNSSSSKRKERDEEDEKEEKDEESEEDEVGLGSEGWKERYYFRKFDCPVNQENIAAIVSREYVRGLVWVLLYYYQGCPDWQWFYPFHYAPFASDFQSIAITCADVYDSFNRSSTPFAPLEQLMSVFPAASGASLPVSWQQLMKDPESPIADFYPSGFKIDLNGKSAAWMGVALLPFIDESRLKEALKSVYGNLNEKEVIRNSRGQHLIFVSKSFKMAKNENDDDDQDENELITNFLTQLDEKKEEKRIPLPVLPSKKFFSGSVKCSMFQNQASNSFCVEFWDPEFDSSFVFPATRLPDAIIPEKVLSKADLAGNTRSSNNFYGGQGGNNNYNSRASYQPHNNWNQGYQNQSQSNRGGGRGGFQHHSSSSSSSAASRTINHSLGFNQQRGGYVDWKQQAGRHSYPPPNHNSNYHQTQNYHNSGSAGRQFAPPAYGQQSGSGMRPFYGQPAPPPLNPHLNPSSSSRGPNYGAGKSKYEPRQGQL